MGVFSKLFSNKKGNYILALDIGTELVKALVVEVNSANKKGNVLGVARGQQRLGNMYAGAVTDIEGVVEICRSVIKKAEKQAKVSAEQAIIGIAGELVKGTTTTVHYERMKPRERIDLKELKEILDKVQWEAFDRVRKQLAWETGINELDVKLVDAAVVDTRIDGYRVTNPLGFQGKDVSISIFNSYAPLVHLGALQSIAADLGLDLLSVAAEPYAVASSVLSNKTENFSAIFIDVGGGTSDVALVRSGGIEGTKMFALGGHAFSKRIAQELKVSFQKAEEMKLDYSRKKLAPDLLKKVREIIQSDCTVWQAGVELALGEFKNVDLLPSKILLCGGGSALPGIKEALKDKEWAKRLPFARPPEVHFMEPQDVVNIVDKTGALVDQQDVTPMGLANLALDLAGEEDVLHGTLRKIIKTIQE